MLPTLARGCGADIGGITDAVPSEPASAAGDAPGTGPASPPWLRAGQHQQRPQVEAIQVWPYRIEPRQVIGAALRFQQDPRGVVSPEDQDHAHRASSQQLFGWYRMSGFRLQRPRAWMP